MKCFINLWQTMKWICFINLPEISHIIKALAINKSFAWQLPGIYDISGSHHSMDRAVEAKLLRHSQTC